MSHLRFPRRLIACGLLATVLRAGGAPPVYDHVVIVIEENESLTRIIGNRAGAPYLNALAEGGVSFTDLHAITHPSEPNYLELFSGSAQGVLGDEPPPDYPFSTPNLGAELFAAGFTFAGYSEDLPADGDADTTLTQATIDGAFYNLYARKHNPWVNWQDATVPTPPNRLPPSTNLRWLDFPTDFTQLPTVAFVVPNEQNDMHDGTVKMGDDWLVANLSAYAEWAKTHNSLLIITWDEDDSSEGNRIPTIFYGANLSGGQNDATWTSHNLLRTLEEMYGLPYAGTSAQVRAISGAFANEPIPGIAKFQQGRGGYGRAHDTQIRRAAPNTTYGATTPLTVVLDDSSAIGNQPVQTLVQFNDLFGHAPGQVPPGAAILSAKLLLTTDDRWDASTTEPINVYRMLARWNETATWNSLGGGLAADGVRAATAADFAVTPRFTGNPAIFDVTATVQAWMNGAPNRGWVVLPTSRDAWSWNSSEAADVNARPELEITFAASLLAFSTATYSVNESAGVATISVTRGGSAQTAVTVDYATSDGTAVAGVDYTPASGTFSWSSGDTTPRTFAIPLLASAGANGLATVNLTLGNPTGIAVLNGPGAATLQIAETPLDAWRVAQFGVNASGPLAANDADPDGDGVSNFLEYAFGSDPRDNASHSTPRLIPGEYAALSFTRLAAATDLTFTVQVSGDLQTWFDGSTYSATGSIPSNQYTTELSHTPGPIETIVVQDNTATTAASARYLRLRVTQP